MNIEPPLMYVDANVFIYATGRDHPLREPCRNILRRWAAADLALLTGRPVVDEVAQRVLGRPDRAAALDAIRHMIGSQIALLDVDSAAQSRALEIITADPSIRWADALHAAVALSAGVTRILTADRDFDRIPGITRVDPAELAGPASA